METASQTQRLTSRSKVPHHFQTIELLLYQNKKPHRRPSPVGRYGNNGSRNTINKKAASSNHLLDAASVLRDTLSTRILSRGTLLKLTNFYGLPQPIYDAIANDPYSKGDADYSITGLLTPPRISQLIRRHSDELVEDVSDRIFSLIGQVTHGILERAEREAWAEPRYFVSIGGKRISGQLDRFHRVNKHIQDYKVTSLFKIHDGLPEEWEQQVNGYAFLARANGYAVDSASVVAILRDWRKRMARQCTDGTYPPHQCAVLQVPIWSNEKVEEFLLERIRIHEAARDTLPECTDKDRWNSGETFAVYKGTSKRAVRVYQTRVEAEQHVDAFGSGYSYQLRRGEDKRCPDFCIVADHCEQWAKRKLNSV